MRALPQAVATERTRERRPDAVRPKRVGGLLLPALALPGWLLFVLPVVALVLGVRPADVVTRLGSPVVTEAITLSLTTTGVTVLLAVLFGTPLGYFLARRRFPGRAVADTVVDLPMVLPPSVAGVALLMAFGRRGLFGEALSGAGIEVAFTQTAVVLAQLFVAAPYFVRAAAGAFARVDRDLEEAASLDGASAWGVFRYVTLPMVLPAMLGGAVMTWARALGEFGATIIFAGNFPGRTQTMPLAIYMGFEIDLGVALTLSAVLLAVSCGVLFAARALVSRGSAEV